MVGGTAKAQKLTFPIHINTICLSPGLEAAPGLSSKVCGCVKRASQLCTLLHVFC